MNSVSDHQTLLDLEFDKILHWCAKYAHSENTRSRILKLVPINDYETILKQINQIEDLKNIKNREKGFPELEFENLESELRLLKTKNAVISLNGILNIHQASYLVNQILSFFENSTGSYSYLEEVLKNSYQTLEIISPIEKVINKVGTIKDTASTELKIIRDSIRRVQRQLRKNFDKELKRLSKINLLSETKETVINNRRVLSVKSSYKKQLSGQVLGKSKAGYSTHIEPKINVDLNIELDDLKVKEEKEIYRILKELTRKLSNQYWLIEAYNNGLHDLDFIYAKFRVSDAMKATKPNISKEKIIHLHEAIHPLLKLKNDQKNKPTYGQNIHLDSEKRMLVISGPNAGGKSVTLKMLGLLQVMAQSGLFITAESENSFGLFRHIYSEIGDNQSIENELSTYSYRLKRIKTFLSISNSETFLLLDEFGSGSDPELGGALAEAIFESFYQKRIFAVLTTHYSNIKTRAVQLPHAINGCMLFDIDSLTPLFKFKLGQPGSSFTFEVAKTNGISRNLIEKAKRKLDQEKLKLNELLSDLQRKNNVLDIAIKTKKIETKEYKDKAEKAHYTQEKFNRKFEKVNQTIQLQQTQLTAGKKMLEFIANFKNSREENKKLFNEFMFFLKQQNKNKLRKKSNLSNRKLSKKQEKTYHQERIKIGSKVKIISTKQSAIVDKINGSQIILNMDNSRIKVGLDKLIWIS